MAKIIGLADHWLRRKREEKKTMRVIFEKDGLELLYWLFESPAGLCSQAGVQGKQPWVAKKKSEQKLARQLRRWFYQVILSNVTEISKAKVLDGWTGALPRESVDLLKQMVEHYEAVGMTAPFIPMYMSLMDSLNGEIDQTVRELVDFKDPGKILTLRAEGLQFLRFVLKNPSMLFGRAGLSGKQQWSAKDKTAQKQVRRLRKWFSVGILDDAKDMVDIKITDDWTGSLPTDAVDRLKEMVEHYEAIGMTSIFCGEYLTLMNDLSGEKDDDGDALLNYVEPPVEAGPQDQAESQGSTEEKSGT